MEAIFENLGQNYQKYRQFMQNRHIIDKKEAIGPQNCSDFANNRLELLGLLPLLASYRKIMRNALIFKRKIVARGRVVGGYGSKTVGKWCENAPKFRQYLRLLHARANKGVAMKVVISQIKASGIPRRAAWPGLLPRNSNLM